MTLCELGNNVEIDSFLNRETELRRRPTVGPGKVKMSMRYDSKKEALKVTVHEASGLPGGDLPDPPDPYVKLYLLPERSKKSKKKSSAIKDTVNPVYEENFDYDIPSSKLASTQLEVTVVDRKGMFSRRATMGRVLINLTQNDISGHWYDLVEVDEDSD